MKITGSAIRRIIREELSLYIHESENIRFSDEITWESFSTDNDRHKAYKKQMRAYNEGSVSKHPMANATVLAGRFIQVLQVDKEMWKKLGIKPHHSWVILYDENGDIKEWFTGKTSEDIDPGTKKTLRRVLMGRKYTDALQLACDEPSIENAKATAWGALEGQKNIDWDHPHTAEARWLVKIPSKSKEEIQKSVESAFSMYTGDNPYDLLPASLPRHVTHKENISCGRNSNSFAHSLLRYAGISSGVLVPLPGTMKYSKSLFPGAELQVNGIPKK